jgi:hypothetical protein
MSEPPNEHRQPIWQNMDFRTGVVLATGEIWVYEPLPWRSTLAGLAAKRGGVGDRQERDGDNLDGALKSPTLSPQLVFPSLTLVGRNGVGRACEKSRSGG